MTLGTILKSIHAEQENRLAELADFLSDAPSSQKAASRAVVE